jgi:hypothetical protein
MIISLKNSSDIIGNRTGDLPVAAECPNQMPRHVLHCQYGQVANDSREKGNSEHNTLLLTTVKGREMDCVGCSNKLLAIRLLRSHHLASVLLNARSLLLLNHSIRGKQEWQADGVCNKWSFHSQGLFHTGEKKKYLELEMST